MYKGLDRFLDQIRVNPRQTLINRYLVLVSDLKSDEMRYARALDLAQTLVKPRPIEALRIAHWIHREERRNLRAYDVMIAALRERGRAGVADVVAYERAQAAGAVRPDDDDDCTVVAALPPPCEVTACHTTVAPLPVGPVVVPPPPQAQEQVTAEPELHTVPVPVALPEATCAPASAFESVAVTIAVAVARAESAPEHLPEPDVEPVPLPEPVPVPEPELPASRIPDVEVPPPRTTGPVFGLAVPTEAPRVGGGSAGGPETDKNNDGGAQAGAVRWRLPEVFLRALAELDRNMPGADPRQVLQLKWGLFQGLWGQEPDEVCLRALEGFGLARATLGFWGLYLDALIATGNGERAVIEMRQTLARRRDLAWAKAAWDRLPTVWRALQVLGFAWREDQGVQGLLRLLRTRPKTRGVASTAASLQKLA